MRESEESAATDESQETPVSKKKKSMLLGRALVSTKGFQKTKRRGKQTWFIGDEYVLEHNVINVEKSRRNNQPWWRAAKKLGRPLRCPDCGLGPYAKIDGDDGHKRSSCTVANRNHKKQYDARKRAGITVNPFSLSQPTVQKKSPVRTGEPSEIHPAAMPSETTKRPTHWIWCHSNSDRDKTTAFRNELKKSARPFQEKLREPYRKRAQRKSPPLPDFYRRNFIVTPDIHKNEGKHRPLSIILWYPELFWAKEGFQYQRCPDCDQNLIAKTDVERLVEDFAGTHVLCAKQYYCGRWPRWNSRCRSSRCFSWQFHGA